MIERYDFGQIVFNGRRFTRDVLIFPGRVKEDWWRREGHSLCVEDIGEAVQERPEIIVVGSGYLGLMKVPIETREFIRSKGIQLIIERTGKACETFNELSKFKRVVAALHLTC